MDGSGALMHLWSEQWLSQPRSKQQFNWKNDERENFKIAKTQLFLTVIFALPIRRDNSVRATAAAGKNMVRGMIHQRGREETIGPPWLKIIIM